MTSFDSYLKTIPGAAVGQWTEWGEGRSRETRKKALAILQGEIMASQLPFSFSLPALPWFGRELKASSPTPLWPSPSCSGGRMGSILLIAHPLPLRSKPRYSWRRDPSHSRGPEAPRTPFLRGSGTRAFSSLGWEVAH